MSIRFLEEAGGLAFAFEPVVAPPLTFFQGRVFWTVKRVDALLGRGRRLPRTRVAENEYSPLFV